MQQFVGKLTGQHEAQCLLDLLAKLLRLPVSFVSTRMTVEEEARVDTVIFLNLTTAREHLRALTLVE
ncbi:MAG: hypothetical protein O3A00_03140 [Planctomycetota bacterium]|nr:hypothetical protein [Planctomycetota bacterium]